MTPPKAHRTHILFVVFLILGAGIALRLFWVQVLHRERFNNPTGIAYQGYQIIPSVKGRILDARGRLLAACRQVCSIAANPQKITDPDHLAPRLAELLEIPESTLREQLRPRLNRVLLRKVLPPELKPLLQPLEDCGLVDLEENPRTATFSVLVQPELLRGQDTAIVQLASLLGTTPASIQAKLPPTVPFVCLAREVDATTAHRIRFLALPGVEVREQGADLSYRVFLTPRFSDLCWSYFSAEDQAGRGRGRLALRDTVWDSLAPVWTGLAPPVRESLESQLQCSFVYLKREVRLEIGRQIEGWGLPGLMVEKERRRIYPFGDLARELLGQTDPEEKGVSGLEKAYDRVLSGIDGKRLFMVDARRNPIPQMQTQFVPPVDGKDLVLTLDTCIQKFAETALAQTLADSEAEWGVALVVDPYTGAILAWADDTRSPSGQSIPYENYGLTRAYEPGSVLKPIVVCAALEEGLVRPDSVFHCPGTIPVGKSQIRCISSYTDRRSHGAETVSEAIRDSCNIVLLQIGQKLGQDRLEKWFQRFHLFERTGLSVVEKEATGGIFTLNPQRRWSPQKVATVSFGKGIQLTPLALVRAYCPIVNGGDLPRLRLVHRLLDRRGAPVVQIPPQVERGVLHPQTAAAVRKMLHRVVWDAQGTGHPARSREYETTGKTGTSPGYRRSDARIVSFLGFAPYRHPRIICSVLVANPRRGSQTGGGTCGPAFRTIVEKTLNYLGVPPEAERLAPLFPAN